MAEEEKQEAAEGAEAENAEESPKKSKKGLMLGGGVVGVLGLAFLASTMAVPKKPVVHRMEGPFVNALSDENISVNLADNDHKRYLQMGLSVEYYAYGVDYFGTRVADPLYQPHLMDALQRSTNARHSSEITGTTNRMIFLEEIAESIDPVIFPVHVGETVLPFDRHEASGLRPGYSIVEGTFRGNIHDHVLKVDSIEKTIRIDDGPVIDFEGDETDLEIPDERGRTVFVNISELTEGFQGDVPVGVHGRIHRILVSGQFLIQ